MGADRTTHWRRSVAVAAAVSALMLAGLTVFAASFAMGHPAPETLVAPPSTAPAGFSVDEASSGSLDRQQLQDSGLSSAMAELASGYRRVWRDEASGQSLQVIAYDFGVASRVAGFLDEFRRKATDLGLAVDVLPEVPGSVRAAGVVDAGSGQVSSAVDAFGRGPLLVVVTAAGPDQSISTVAATMASTEVDLVSSQYAGAPSVAYDAAEAAGAITGGLVIYFLLVGVWAWFRDPLRRSKEYGSWSPRALGPGPVIAVDARAGRLRRKAAGIVLAQVTGLVLIASALLPNDPPVRATLVGVGCLLWASASLGHRGRPQRWTRALPWNTAALLGLGAGLVCVAFGAREQGANTEALAGVFFFAAAGISHRWGRRVSARAARQALARDPRPVVLFLRSFGDDKRRLRSGLGRQSLIEKLAPNRFDSFEEVLVRHLTRLGPVVALNPPGTKLSPIGAARVTLSSDNWQPQVDEWITNARLVVIAAPPERVTEGLMWELGRIGQLDRWGNAAVVVPPVSADEARRRWDELATHSAHRPPFDYPVPVDPAQVILLLFESGHWTAATGIRRDEWTYAAALDLVNPETESSPALPPTAGPNVVIKTD